MVHWSVFAALEFLEWIAGNEKGQRQNRSVSGHPEAGWRRGRKQVHGGTGDEADPWKVSECRFYEPQDRVDRTIAARWDLSPECARPNLQDQARRRQMADRADLSANLFVRR